MAHIGFGGPQIPQRHVRELEHRAKLKHPEKGYL